MNVRKQTAVCCPCPEGFRLTDCFLVSFKPVAASGHSAAERRGAGPTAGGEQQTQRVPQLLLCEEAGRKGKGASSVTHEVNKGPQPG